MAGDFLLLVLEFGTIRRNTPNLFHLIVFGHHPLDFVQKIALLPLPPALCELKDLIWLYLQDNSFTGLLPLDVGNLVAVDKMDISVNLLSGELPVSLSELQRLEYLNLSKNSFDGHIPGNLDGMVNIKIIDLSHNKLRGGIPKSLENLQQLQVLDLSFNRLEGAIPSGGNFTNLSIDSFVRNYALCGAPKFHVPVCSDGVKKHNIVNMIKVDIFLASGGFALLLIVCILIFVARYRKRGLERHYHEVERFRGIALPVITYRMLSQATNNFSDANFMGSGSFGSVYKGILADGTTVAVKVLNLLSEGASKSFDIDCSAMCQIIHRNLLRVITSCSFQGFSSPIHAPWEPRSLSIFRWPHLNLLQRLDIMIDVACALEYLHHGCWETIVHCDLKPSNVLLDENMTAHVGDFGIAKMLVGHKSSTLTSTLGTTGYIAPEFGAAGKVSTKADVYSYGILLLEVFTRRKPTDESFNGDFTLRQWVAEVFPLAISDVIDGHILKQNNSETVSDHAAEGQLLKQNNSGTVLNELLVMIMDTGLSCSRKAPTERMGMKEVVARLKTIRWKASLLEE
ncbi:putative LRR receptor-like serine/threonine-protein kinase [Nymphaea thermarum]|nr:putative LRR receptor-like serine/threonine-protein kinase [Nymphaea thermarum]